MVSSDEEEEVTPSEPEEEEEEGEGEEAPEEGEGQEAAEEEEEEGEARGDSPSPPAESQDAPLFNLDVRLKACRLVCVFVFVGLDNV